MSNLRDQQSELSFQLQNGLLLSRQKSLEEARGEEEKPDKQMHTKLRLLPTLEASSTPLKRSDLRHQAFFIGQIVLLVVVVVQFIMLYRTCILAAAGVANAGLMKKQASSSSSSRPDYYQTSPELWPGPTPTGPAPFLAETNPAPFSSTTYIPNSPLETQVPIKGNSDNGNIFQLHGQLSHYFPNPVGFGVDEYSLPKDAHIAQLHMLSRHGSRYPTVGAGAQLLAEKIQNFTNGTLGEVTFTGELSFLNNWQYTLGNEILVPVGKQELFDSGTLHQYMYGHLYPNNGSKIVARSTTQDRMTKSAEYFLAGFFGLEWTSNATLVLAIETETEVWNNTLAGYFNCDNSYGYKNEGGDNATEQWVEIYLADATERLAPNAGKHFNWTAEDSYNAQSLCAYETVAVGYSSFCGLFTYEEWEGYEYSIDINFAGQSGFQSPTGRAVGAGYVEEIRARLEHHLIEKPTAQVNVTLDSNPKTFPLNQALNFDFSHDTNIMGILTAFGFTQFAEVLPVDHIKTDRQLVVSHMEPFAARLDIEVINTPSPLDGKRSEGDKYLDGDETTYVHFILNQRTLPLGVSYPECGPRDDGWCTLETFLDVLSTKLEEAQYDYSCNGDWPVVPYGALTDGVPPPPTGTLAA
ncbi:hypothetical protein LTR37_010747 [Vermiconidia calcicola]|uniref:Uncharacterized protein n=1 Tax=Vermiconidia calcicola TaxID=1690605 RepID=A0ACC3N464_9PEZI|nr:hypothetical protein LTR37_010747 [Vermiconidia calcicola]